MAKITSYEELCLDDLKIGKGQARISDFGDIQDLAKSIETQGLLQPILVCESEELGKWEILAGQRRFLAHKKLGKDTIVAAVLDERVDEGTAKAISITENLMRHKLSGKDLIDGVTYLYNKYGTQKAVVEATGLPASKVRDCVKYPRLIPELKELVDDGSVDVNVALKAQDAAVVNDDEIPDTDIATKLAKEMALMPGVQRKKIVKQRKENPSEPIDEVIEKAKSGSREIQVVATLSQDTHTALQNFATNENMNQDEAAAMLIEQALVEGGFLNE